MRYLAFSLSLLTGLTIGLATTAAGEVPLEADAFSVFVGDIFQHALPGSKVTVSGPLTLKIVVRKMATTTLTLRTSALFIICACASRVTATWPSGNTSQI